MTCAGLGRLADEITVTTEDDGITIEPRVKSSLAGDVEPALVDVADGSTNDVVVRDERDVSYRRIAKLPTLMPIPMSGSLVIRQNSTHYAVFSMHGTDVRYETVNGDDSQAGSVAALRLTAHVRRCFSMTTACWSSWLKGLIRLILGFRESRAGIAQY